MLPYPTIADATEAASVLLTFATKQTGDVPLAVQAGYIITGYGLSIGLPLTKPLMQAVPVETLKSELAGHLKEQAQSPNAGANNSAFGSKIDWSKIVPLVMQLLFALLAGQPTA